MGMTNGMKGLWFIGGAPGVGKSTLVMQMLLDLAFQGVSVYFFNFEMDEEDTDARVCTGWPGSPENLDKAKEQVTQFFFPEDIKELEGLANAQHEQDPTSHALFVIDTFQNLPVPTNNARTGYEQWLETFSTISRKYQYPFLITSQKVRGLYDDPVMWAFKETSKIESTMTVGLQVIPIEGIFGAMEVHIVKNRHAKYTGHCLNLFRETDWWYKEEGIG